MDTLPFSNNLLLQAITTKDYDRIEKLAKLSDRDKISLDKRVVDAAKSSTLKCLHILFDHAYNGVSTFIEYMSPDDDPTIFNHIIQCYNGNLNEIIYNAVTRECYKIINLLMSLNYVNTYGIFAIAFSHGKKNVIKYLRDNYIDENDLYPLFEYAYYNHDFKLMKYCIDECDEHSSQFVLFLYKLSYGLLLYDLYNERTCSVLECVVLLLNKGANIDVIGNDIPDDNLLFLYKMGVTLFGKFTRRIQVLLIREYAIKEEIRETIPELPDELTNLITGY